MRKLSDRDRKVLYAGGAVTLLILLVLYVVLPVYEAAADVDSELDFKKRQLSQYVQAIQEQDLYRAELEEMDRLLEQYRQRLLDARDASAAVSRLEQLVRGVADPAQVRVSRSNPMQERRIGDEYMRITLQVTLDDSEIERLTDFLYGLATHPKYLVVDEFNLSTQTRRGATRPRIQTRMQVSGFIRLS